MRMTKTTERALRASVRKWERYRTLSLTQIHEQEIELGPADCPLCKLHHNNSTVVACVRCPVMARTTRPYCIGTPYKAAYNALYFIKRSLMLGVQSPETHLLHLKWVEKAGEEVQFLKSLLPRKAKRNANKR